MNERNIFLTASMPTGDLKKVAGVAYGGGEVRQWWTEKPIFIDLNGMAIAPQIPLMYNHQNDPEYRLGVITAEITGGKVMVNGGIDTDTERGREIAEAGKKVNWQLSIGAEIKRTESVEEETEVNGRTVEPPALVVRECLLREVSVVAIGADAETELSIVAGWNIKNSKQNNSNGVEPMSKIKCEGECPTVEDETKVTAETAVEPEETAGEKDTAVVEEEETKVTAEEEKEPMAEEIKQRFNTANIVAVLDGAPTDVVVKAIKQGWTLDMAKAVADSVKAVKANKPSTANIVIKDNSATADSIEASLVMRAGFTADEVASQYGEKTAEKALRMRGMSLKDTLRECLKLAGKFSSDYIGHEDIQAGFQTTDLPRLLGNVANKALLKAYNAREIASAKLCSAGDIADYKEASRVRLADLGALNEIPEGGEVTETAVGEDYAVNQIKRYAQILWLDEKLIINDDLGAFTRLPQIMGAKAADFVDATFFAKLTANGNFTDGTALFHANHGNYKTGADTALSLDALKKAYSAMRKQKDKGGMPLNIVPKYLVVPADLEAEALELTTSQIVVGGSSRGAGENIVSKWGLQVIASPYLDGNSTKAWYLFGDPAVCDTFEIGYLRGQRTPVVEQGAYDLSRFGVCYRVRFDFGVNALDFRSIYKAKGEA